MDFNHPLSGQRLTFDVEIVDISAPAVAAPEVLPGSVE
jgi:FKBP-type peptidyl-prolyl cis-trans isomerase 2